MKTGGMKYLTSAFETFDSVALEVYGDEKYAAELMSANPKLCGLPLFTGGELVSLPEIEIPDGETAFEYAPAAAPWKE